MPVGGSRHYPGPGLGKGLWKCPACGADNAGAIADGCQLCGAGKPGRRAEAPPPPPETEQQQGDVADHWAGVHQTATIAEAYRAGFQDGVRAARAAAPPPEPANFSPEGRMARTVIAALELFRDQILSTNPEETRTGEWMTAKDATDLIARLHRQEYPVHA